MRASVLVALLLVGLVACQNVELNILHTNDVHAHYTPWTTPSGALCLSGSLSSCLGGFARAYTSLFATIQRFKASGEAYLLADAGDQMQGTPFYDQTGYIISAYFMNLIGYDLFIPGHREFDNGPGFAAAFFAAINNTKIVATNMDTRADPGFRSLTNLFRSTTIVRNGQTYGILGAAIDNMPLQTYLGSGTVVFPHFDLIKQGVQTFKEQGVNKVIVISHCGFDDDTVMGRTIDGVDIVIGGHSHTILGNITGAAGAYPYIVTGPSGKKSCVVQAGPWMQYLGSFKAIFDSNGDIVDCVGTPVTPIQVDSAMNEDPAVKAFVDQYVPAVASLLNTPLGSITCQLTVGNVRQEETPLGDFVADAFQNIAQEGYASYIDVGICNGGAIRTTIPAGAATVNTVLPSVPFPNDIVIVGLNGTGLIWALENAVSRLTTDGSIAGQSGTGRYLQISSTMKFTFNYKAPAFRRVSNVQMYNKDTKVFEPLDAQKIYTIATVAFVANGGDDQTVFLKTPFKYTLQLDVNDAMYRYIRKLGTVPCPYNPASLRITLDTNAPINLSSAPTAAVASLALLLVSAFLLLL